MSKRFTGQRLAFMGMFSLVMAFSRAAMASDLFGAITTKINDLFGALRGPLPCAIVCVIFVVSAVGFYFKSRELDDTIKEFVKLAICGLFVIAAGSFATTFFIPEDGGGALL